MGAGYGGDSPRRFFKLLGGFLVGHVAALHLQQAGDNGQAVFHPVIHFLHEELLAFERRFQVTFITLALNCHAEDVCGPLQEGEIVFDKFIVRLAVDLQNAKRLAVTLEDDIHCPLDAMLDQHLRGAKALLVFEMVGNDRLTRPQGKSSGNSMSAPMLATPTMQGSQPTPACTRRRFSSGR